MIQSRRQLLCTVSPPVSVVFLLQVVHSDAAGVLHVDFGWVSLLQTHNQRVEGRRGQREIFSISAFQTCLVPYTLRTLHDTPYSTLHFKCQNMYLKDLTPYVPYILPLRTSHVTPFSTLHFKVHMLYLKDRTTYSTLVPYSNRQPARRHPTDPPQHQRFPPTEICKVVFSYLRSCWQ